MTSNEKKTRNAQIFEKDHTPIKDGPKQQTKFTKSLRTESIFITTKTIYRPNTLVKIKI